eukprot:9334602-Pyramimonas_sp.AAC.1
MADPAPVLFGSNRYPIELTLRWRAGIRSKMGGKNTRALTNGSISRNRIKTEQKYAKLPSGFFLQTSPPARPNYSSSFAANALREAL